MVFVVTHGEWLATRGMIHAVKKLLDGIYQPDGYTMGWNCGEAEGEHVFHAHLRIFPHHKDESYAGKGLRYWLKQEENKRK